MTRVWMDQGGTFTDVVRVDRAGHVRIEKVLSETASLATLAEGIDDVRRGTTRATNALLEGTTPPVLLVTNIGFEDLPWIGDGRRPDLFRLDIRRPPPLCSVVLGARGRIGADGAVLEPASVDQGALTTHRRSGIESVAIVLIHGPLHPESERALAAQCVEAGFKTISMGHVIAPSRGFLVRLQTTLADAALSPLLPRAPGLYMRSDGGLSRAEDWTGAHAILSGPAGGVVATAAIAEEAGVPMAFGLDMGGTSTDICRVAGDLPRRDHINIGGMQLRIPSLAIETIAAGGGSILSITDGMMAVGPHSAGSVPGPAAYGRGGPPTLTDAEAVLGRLPGFPKVCGSEGDAALDVEAARAALKALHTGLEVEEAAQGFKTIAAEAAARAIRGVAANMGVDPSDHALIAFGGAGPGHACAIAEALGITTVLIPRLAGVFSAVGIGRSSRRAERVEIVRESIAEAGTRATEALPFDGDVRLELAARHVGTATIITLPATLEELPEAIDITPLLRRRFDALHHARFGFDRPDQAIEIIEARASVETPSLHVPWQAESACAADQTTSAWFGEWMDVPLLDMGRAEGIAGPAILTGGGCTVVVDPNWTVAVTPSHVRLDYRGKPRTGVTASPHPVHTAVFAARVMAIAEQMGERLGRLARSVSIRERLDFSCAVFDAEGALVANAPHVPVHLGAMGETVKDLIMTAGPRLLPGTTWASNDPYAGGSHLPDITVVRPVFFHGERVAFVACRGHHVDIGGTTPGSMPPDSTTIDEEGLRFRNHLLCDASGFRCPALPGVRSPDEVEADLRAQNAAVGLGEAALTSLIRSLGASVVEAQMAHLQEAAGMAVERALRGRPGSYEAEEVLDDGTAIQVHLRVQDGRAEIRLSAPAHPGNLNTPRAVAIAATLYVLRSLVDEPHQLLNAGSLRPIRLVVSEGSLFAPSAPAAVVGGNVETSQRLVDALLRGLGAQASSQGTMNNLTVGSGGGVWYETLPGGSGAGPNFNGCSATQVHMTNTKTTDVELIEARFPVRITRLEIRRGSGGSGAHTGGCGLIKEWLFLAPAEVSLLAERRAAGAPGASGGRPGLPGVDEVHTGTGWSPMPKRWRARAGDRLRILTPGGGGFGQTD